MTEPVGPPEPEVDQPESAGTSAQPEEIESAPPASEELESARIDLAEPFAEPLAAPEPGLPGQPHIPTVIETVRTAVDALVESGSDLRRLSIVAVAFGVVFVSAPLISAIAYFLTLPLFSSFGATEDTLLSVLGIGAVASLFAGIVGSFVLSIQFPLLIVAVVGARIAGQSLTLRQGLKRARQVFWRAVGATIAVGLVAGVPAGVVALITTLWLGPSTQLSLGVQIVASVLLASPWVYVLPGIVLGGVGAGEAIRRSWSLARFRWRLALTISLLGVVGGQIVTAAALAAIGVVLTVAVLAPGATALATTASPVLVAGAVLVGAVVVTSLFFATQAVQVAPETSGFYALTGYAAALDEARTGAREPLLRRPSRLIYGVGLVATIGLAVGLLGAWPISERGPWQRGEVGGVSFDVPLGWRNVGQSALVASFSNGSGRISVHLDLAARSVGDAVDQHFEDSRLATFDVLTVSDPEDIDLGSSRLEEQTVEAFAVTTDGIPSVLAALVDTGKIASRDFLLAVTYPYAEEPLAGLYGGEAKRFSRHIWLSTRAESAASTPAPSQGELDREEVRRTAERYLLALARDNWGQAWVLLSPYARDSFGTIEAFQVAQAAYKEAGGKLAEAGDPTRDPAALSAVQSSDAFSDVQRTADGTRAYLVVVDHPNLLDATAARTRLIISPVDGQWMIWIAP